jgi:protein PhnA
MEVAPIPEEPVVESALLLCGACADLLSSPVALDKRLKREGAESLRFLQETVWSDTPAVQVVVVRLLRRLVEKGHSWAGEPLESVWLDDERETWISASSL